MAIQITVYSFSKRENSTRRPTEGGLSIECYLKEETSKYNPSFKVFDVNMLQYNYLKWNDLYYYISDVISIANNQWQVECNIDVLASYKEDIAKVRCFQTYSTLGYNQDIIDTRLSTKKNAIINTVNKPVFNQNGGYFVSYVGTNANTNVFIKGTNGFNILKSKLMSDDLYETTLKDVADYLSKKVNSATDCIISAHYSPIEPDLGGSFNILLGGGYNTEVVGYATDHNYEETITISIPWNFSDFRNRSQFTSLILYLPGYGVTELNADDFNGQTSITIYANYDVYNGDLCYRIGERARYMCNIAVPVAVGTVSTGSTQSLLSSGESVMMGAMVGSPELVGAGLFNGLLSSLSRSVGSTGSNGGASSWLSYTNIALTALSHDTTIPPSEIAEEYGRPVNAIKVITNGYNQCVNADVYAPTSKENIQAINSYMNGGFYYE